MKRFKPLCLSIIVLWAIVSHQNTLCVRIPYFIRNAYHTLFAYDEKKPLIAAWLGLASGGLMILRNPDLRTKQNITHYGACVGLISLTTSVSLWFNQRARNNELQCAISRNLQQEAAQALAQGANPNHAIYLPEKTLDATSTRISKTPLMYSIMDNRSYPYYEEASKVVSSTNVNIIRELIAYGADVNQTSCDQHQITPLMATVQKSSSTPATDTIEELLQAQSNVHAFSSHGHTALHYTWNKKHTKTLLDQGINSEAYQVPLKDTALEAAIRNYCNSLYRPYIPHLYEKITTLLRHGASVTRWKQYFKACLTQESLNLLKLLMFFHNPENDPLNQALMQHIESINTANDEEESIKKTMLFLLQNHENLLLLDPNNLDQLRYLSPEEEKEFGEILHAHSKGKKEFKSRERILGEKIFKKSFTHFEKTNNKAMENMSDIIAGYTGGDHPVQ